MFKTIFKNVIVLRKYDFQRSLSTLVNTKLNKKGNIKKLQELLNINNREANTILTKNPNINKIPFSELNKNYVCCIENGLDNKLIIEYVNILQDLQLCVKLKVLKNLEYDVTLTTPLVLISLKKLIGFVQEEASVKRIENLAKLFQADIGDVCKWISSKQFLTSINMDNVYKSVKLLLDCGVGLEAIIKDLWVLRYSPGVIEERIKFAKESNIDSIKTWMIRAQMDILDKYVQRRSDTKEILGDKNNLVEYLSEKLECSNEVSKFLISKQPALQKKSLKKMDDMINFLLIKGFKPIHICRTPKILLHKVETIRQRLRELEANNTQLASLHILTKSEKQYKSIVESLKAKNKEKL